MWHWLEMDFLQLLLRIKQGTSPLISGNYSGYNGYYNYFNIGAYTTSSASATVNGLIYAKNNDWNSIYKSINGGAGIVGK